MTSVRFLRRLLAAGLLFWAGQAACLGQTGLKIRLVPETRAIVPGQPFRVGLFLQHDPGWHTYWRQPGIVGVPTQMVWALPEGFRACELEYPEPESVLMFRIKAQGYERDVLLQTVITPPASLTPGQSILLKGRASWMCCGNTCHPASLELALRLPVASKSRPDPEWQPRFERERQAYPRPSAAWEARAEEDGLQMTLRLTPRAGARPFQAGERVLFFTEDGWINSDEPQVQTIGADGSLTLGLRRADVFLGQGVPAELRGVVQREGGWLPGENWRSLSIAPKIHRQQALPEVKPAR